MCEQVKNSDYCRVFKELSVVQEVILRGTKLVIPPVLRGNLLELAHRGHPGQTAMLTQLRPMVWWPQMTEDVRVFVETCNVGCGAAVGRLSPPTMEIRDTPKCVWQHLSTDYNGPIAGKYYLHVLIDNLSCWPEVKVISCTRGIF